MRVAGRWVRLLLRLAVVLAVVIVGLDTQAEPRASAEDGSMAIGGNFADIITIGLTPEQVRETVPAINRQESAAYAQEKVWVFVRSNWWWVVLTGAYVLWWLSCLLLYAVRPLVVLRLAQGIDNLELPGAAKWTVNPRRLVRQVLLGSLPFRPRVLDA